MFVNNTFIFENLFESQILSSVSNYVYENLCLL